MPWTTKKEITKKKKPEDNTKNSKCCNLSKKKILKLVSWKIGWMSPWDGQAIPKLISFSFAVSVCFSSIHSFLLSQLPDY